MEKIQADFLSRVAARLGKSKLMAHELAEALGVSKSEAYNKVNGRSFLTTSQILKLCDLYDVDFYIHGQKNIATAAVNFTPFHATELTVEDYINRLGLFLQKIAIAKQKKLTCATDDIPVFHLFKYPEITAFKLHFWNARVTKNKTFEFDFSWPDKKILRSAEQLHSLYQSIPCVEIWTKSSLLNTVDQIKYAFEARIIKDKALGKLICQQLRATLEDIELYAVTRSKSLHQPALFEWYFYDIIGCITYLAETDGDMNTFLRFNTFNTLQAQNGPLCNEVRHWLDNLIQDSTGFSGQGSIQRNRYLHQAYETCDRLADMF